MTSDTERLIRETEKFVAEAKGIHAALSELNEASNTESLPLSVRAEMLCVLSDKLRINDTNVRDHLSKLRQLAREPSHLSPV